MRRRAPEEGLGAPQGAQLVWEKGSRLGREQRPRVRVDGVQDNRGAEHEVVHSDRALRRLHRLHLHKQPLAHQATLIRSGGRDRQRVL